MQENIIDYIKQKTLKNYFNTDRDFSKLFPEENFNFVASEYTHFLYFDKEEAKDYLLDFMLFIKTFYGKEVFSYSNYFSIMDEFKKYMESNKVFLYLKTKMGLKIANYNNDLLVDELKKLFGKEYILSDEKNIAFGNILNNKNDFTYPFFDYLLKKLDGYNNYKYLVEPILNDEIEKIRKFFKGSKYNKSPFFLKTSNKEMKKILLDKLVTSSPNEVFCVSKNNVNICLIIATINNNICDLSILCDNECYDSELAYPISFISNHLFKKYDLKKIVTVNENKDLAYSGINSALMMSRFKPDYSLNSEYDGYSKIKYELDQNENQNNEIIVDTTLIHFEF